MGNENIECTVRFSGSAKDIVVPVAAVAAIYARENGQGMAFELGEASEQLDAPSDTGEPPKSGGKPTLKRVK
jgi:stringent starvation protein B